MGKEGLGLEITELRLGLPGADSDSGHHCDVMIDRNKKKRVFSEISEEEVEEGNRKKTTIKSQVAGWPPVCSYRKNNSFSDNDGSGKASKMYVKVGMDGAPFLRKIDLGVHEGYSYLAKSLEKLFGKLLFMIFSSSS